MTEVVAGLQYCQAIPVQGVTVDDEIQLISDGDGLAVIGPEKDVDRFLLDLGATSSEPLFSTTSAAAATLGQLLQAGGVIAANAGRWVKLTEESAQKVKEFGLLKSSSSGLSLGTIGAGGRGGIRGVVEFAEGPRSVRSIFDNPAALASVGALLAQHEMQRSIEEIKEYLVAIGEKVDDVLRAQKDAVFADMIGVDLVLDEAMAVRDQVGHVSDVTWSKVQASSAIIARTQAYAVRQLDALADKLEAKNDLGELSEATTQAETKVHEWLAVLARSFQLLDQVAVLELDRVQWATPDELDQHTAGLRGARERRIATIAGSTSKLIEKMNAAASRANAKVLFNPFESPAVVRSSNGVIAVVVEFQERVGIESGVGASEARRWRDAVVDVRERALDTGSEGVARASEASGRFFTQVAERARRRRPRP